MSFTVGRASFDNNPSGISHFGDLVQFEVDILPSTLAEAKVLRQQVLGLANNPDEPVVPVTWSADSDYDGFYRVASVSVDPVQSYLSNNLMRCRIDVERVAGGYAQPLMEATIISGSRSTAASAVSAAYIYAMPDTVLQADDPLTTRTTDTGAVRLFSQGSGASSRSYYIASGDALDGACVVEQSVGGSWYPVIGRQAQVSATNLRISNGLVRLTWSAADTMAVSIYDGTTWDAVGSFTLARATLGTLTSVVGYAAILRNDPVACVIEFGLSTASGVDQWSEKLTIGVRRGMHHFDLRATLDFADTWWVNGTDAATSITGGMRQTSNGATGHRWVVASEDSFGFSSPRINSSSTTSFPFGIGVELDGSSATTQNTATAVVAQYWGAVSSVDRQVSR